MENEQNSNYLDFNENYWSFIYLITSDDKYLSFEGKILKEIVANGGAIPSITMYARKTKTHKPKMHKIFKKIQEEGIIQIFKADGCCKIMFNDKIKEEGLKLPYSLFTNSELQQNQNEF